MGKTKDVTTETTKEVCGTIFDDVFRTIAQKMPFLLIPLINGKRTISSTLTNICRSHG